MNFDSIDTFFKQIPKPAEVKEQIASCLASIKDHHACVTAQRAKIKQLNRLLRLSEAEAGKAPVKRGPRKKKTEVAESPVDIAASVEAIAEAAA